jgi:hypothetical protein
VDAVIEATLLDRRSSIPEIGAGLGMSCEEVQHPINIMVRTMSEITTSQMPARQRTFPHEDVGETLRVPQA